MAANWFLADSAEGSHHTSDISIYFCNWMLQYIIYTILRSFTRNL